MSAAALPRKAPARSRAKPVIPLPDDGRLHYPKPLLTASERHFMDLLQEAVPEHYIFPQVCMGAIIDPPGFLHGAQRMQARAPYQSKMVDFVVYDGEANKIVCLVELDDYTHDDKEDRDAARDAICEEAGYTTVRIDGRRIPEQGVLRYHILNGITPKRPARPRPHKAASATPATPMNVREGVFWVGLALSALLLGTFTWVVVPASRQEAAHQQLLERSKQPRMQQVLPVDGRDDTQGRRRRR